MPSRHSVFCLPALSVISLYVEPSTTFLIHLPVRSSGERYFFNLINYFVSHRVIAALSPIDMQLLNLLFLSIFLFI